MCGIIESIKRKRQIYLDLSLWSLVLVNLYILISALIENWSLGTLMLTYWCQSISIGFFWYLKILMLKNFSAEGVKINDIPVEATPETKIKLANFFLLHFGLFHLLYLFFLLVAFKFAFSRQILYAAAIFLIYQCFSFVYNKKWETTGKAHIEKLMMFPYARIIPMHLTILFGGIILEISEKPVLVIFILFKIAADLVMHIFETKGFTAKEEIQETA